MTILSPRQIETLKTHGFTLSKTNSYLDDGTFSTVLKVTDESGAPFAIKIVDKLIVLKHGKGEAILTEKRIHLPLTHRNIVKLFSTFQDVQSLYFVLELCEGGNLLKYIKERLSESIISNSFDNETTRTRSLTIQLISAVKYLHTEGILHRDIKPENILISKCIDLKLADFGSAISLFHAQSQSFESREFKLEEELNKFVGTPEYLAPEILIGAIQVDQIASAFALDWWAVGCTLYWLLTGGKVLFEAGTEYLVYKAIQSGPTPICLKECCDLDGVLAEIIFGLLEGDPRKRIKFVNEQLDQLLEELKQNI